MLGQHSVPLLKTGMKSSRDKQVGIMKLRCCSVGSFVPQNEDGQQTERLIDTAAKKSCSVDSVYSTVSVCKGFATGKNQGGSRFSSVIQGNIRE